MKPTIENLMKQSTKLLKVYGFERPRHESIIIFKNILKKSYLDILSNSDLKISISKKNKILENLFKRLKGKPLSKIFGVLKNPLANKKIIIPIIGPNPKMKRTNFAEFFV